MSNLERDPREFACGGRAAVAMEPVRELLAASEVVSWMAGQGFGTVHGYDGDPLPAPPMPKIRLKPRGRHR